MAQAKARSDTLQAYTQHWLEKQKEKPLDVADVAVFLGSDDRISSVVAETLRLELLPCAEAWAKDNAPDCMTEPFVNWLLSDGDSALNNLAEIQYGLMLMDHAQVDDPAKRAEMKKTMDGNTADRQALMQGLSEAIQAASEPDRPPH